MPNRRFVARLPIFGEREMGFAGDLALLDNFDVVGEVVEHFLKVNHLQGIPPVRDNVFSVLNRNCRASGLQSRSELRCGLRIWPSQLCDKFAKNGYGSYFLKLLE